MDLEKRPVQQSASTESWPVERTAPQPERQVAERQAPDGCLAVAIRIPVRIVVLVLVVPVRMAWDALVIAGRFLNDALLRPLGRALLWVGRAVFVWSWVALWRYVVVPVAKGLGWLAYRLLVVPVVWLYRYLLTPVGHGIAWAARGLWAGVVWAVSGVWAGVVWSAKGIGAVLGWVHRWTLLPLGRGIAWVARGIGVGVAAIAMGVFTVVAWLVRYLLVVPAVWVYSHVLTPVGHAVAWAAGGVVWLVRMIFVGLGLGLYWTARVLFVVPALALWRWVLTPVGRALVVVGREIGDALGHAWRVAGRISLVVGRFLATLFRWIFVEPTRWVYRTVLTPAGHLVRDVVWKPAAAAARTVRTVTRQALASARESVRQARADFRRMLFGGPREPKRPEPVSRREPRAAEARTLGSSTTALTKD